ncbi:hypothetical protein ACVWWP_000321 [Bradyrhizobium sp. LM3.6]
MGFAVLDVTLAVQAHLKDIWLDRGSVGEPVFHDSYFDKKSAL